VQPLHTPAVAYAVAFMVEAELPALVREEVTATLKQIGEVTSTLPESTALWRSIGDSVLQFEQGGYRFWYRVDRRARLIVVVHIDEMDRRSVS
jgi:mRNA-degrading endonuclease RelE of RelBE toxin-antitoxin system